MCKFAKYIMFTNKKKEKFQPFFFGWRISPNAISFKFNFFGGKFRLKLSPLDSIPLFTGKLFLRSMWNSHFQNEINNQKLVAIKRKTTAIFPKSIYHKKYDRRIQKSAGVSFDDLNASMNNLQSV